MGNKKEIDVAEESTLCATQPIPIKKKFKYKYQEEHAYIFDEPIHDNFFKHMRLVRKKPKKRITDFGDEL